MAVKLIPVKCPECGAMLNIEENRTQAFCTYCGAKVLVHSDNEFTYRHVDVADIERAETDRLVRLKELELKEKRRNEKEKIRSTRSKYAVIFSIVGLTLMGIGFSAGDSNSGLFALAAVGVWVLIPAALLFAKNLKDDDNS